LRKDPNVENKMKFKSKLKAALSALGCLRRTWWMWKDTIFQEVILISCRCSGNPDWI